VCVCVREAGRRLTLRNRLLRCLPCSFGCALPSLDFVFIYCSTQCLRIGWLPSDRICLHVAQLEQVGYNSKNI